MKGYEVLNFQFGFEREHDALEWIRRKSQIRLFRCLPSNGSRRQMATLEAVAETEEALVTALEKAGVGFMAENGEGSGVRLAKRARKSK